MQKEGVRPEDFMMTRVPVLPPSYRPISAMGSMTMVADPNYMYKALVDTMTDYKESKDLPKELQNKARGEMYQAYRALVGTQDPNQEKLQEKKIGGMLDQILGKGSPKASMWQRRVLGSNMDMYGLSAISLNPALKINQVGVPESKAWEIYSPFVVKELIRQGNDATSAVRDIKNHSPNALKALQTVLKERPVLINRAPTLHKYSIMPAWPVLTQGHTLQIPPAICKNLGADFDGDTISYSVPVSYKAVEEAKSKMMPEKNLISIANDQPMYVPSQEYNMGGYLMSKEPAQEKSQTFRSWKDAVQAYKQGKIKVDTPVRIA
jgi:DNA-directed RNA polymerase subunit beta'